MSASVKSKKYFIFDPIKNAFEECEGKAVNLNIKGDFFYAKFGALFSIYEGSTGWLMCSGKTLNLVKCIANSQLESNSHQWETILSNTIERTGLSPRYAMVQNS